MRRFFKKKIIIIHIKKNVNKKISQLKKIEFHNFHINSTMNLYYFIMYCYYIKIKNLLINN